MLREYKKTGFIGQFKERAGDGTRTRDSLLGKQALTRTRKKSCQSACQAD